MSWSQEEKDLLISLYAEHSDKEICDILNKTPGQIRGIKERLHLNAKMIPFTEAEKQRIVEWYTEHPDAISLDELALSMGRQKTSISRFARKCGLTNCSRKMTDAARKKLHAALEEYRKTERYLTVVKQQNRERLLWYLNNNHPKGMLGKHHTESVCKRISDAVTQRFANMSAEDRRAFAEKQRSSRIKKNPYATSSHTYSRGHGGKRDDIGEYFRSSWEANIARVLNAKNISWKFEPKRFQFPDDGSGIISYCPDFYLDSVDLWVEVKGWMDDNSRIRIEKFRKYYPTEFEKLVIIGEKEYLCIEKIYSRTIHMWESTKTKRTKGGKSNG